MASESVGVSMHFRIRWWHFLAAALMALLSYLGYAMTPTHMIADDKPPMNLEAIVPKQFGVWREDPAMAALVVDPTVQKQLDSLYSQTLSRTYEGPGGVRVMLSIAYGKNQNTESTAAHRPEFCYTAQGWIVRKEGLSPVELNGHRVTAVRLDATAADQRQPITYWVTLNEEASVPGWRRKMHQLKFGLQGLIVDGMLVRVSTVRPLVGAKELAEDYAIHDRFLKDMELAVPTGYRARFFGS